MKGIELSSIDQAVKIVEIFSQPVWAELTSGLEYSELVKTVH